MGSHRQRMHGWTNDDAPAKITLHKIFRSKKKITMGEKRGVKNTLNLGAVQIINGGRNTPRPDLRLKPGESSSMTVKEFHKEGNDHLAANAISHQKIIRPARAKTIKGQKVLPL